MFVIFGKFLLGVGVWLGNFGLHGDGLLGGAQKCRGAEFSDEFLRM